MTILIRNTGVINKLTEKIVEPQEKKEKSPLVKNIKSVSNTPISFLTKLKNSSINIVKGALAFVTLTDGRSSLSKEVVRSKDSSVVLLSCKKVLEPDLMFQKDLKQQFQNFDIFFAQDFIDSNPEERQKAIDCVMAGIYSDAKNEIRYLCEKNRKDIPNKYLEELGKIANDWGVKCKQSKGILEPTGAGSSPFITMIVSPLQKKHPEEVKAPELRRMISDHINLTVDATVESIANKGEYKSTIQFKNEVAKLNQQWASAIFSQ